MYFQPSQSLPTHYENMEIINSFLGDTPTSKIKVGGFTWDWASCYKEGHKCKQRHLDRQTLQHVWRPVWQETERYKHKVTLNKDAICIILTCGNILYLYAILYGNARCLNLEFVESNNSMQSWNSQILTCRMFILQSQSAPSDGCVIWKVSNARSPLWKVKTIHQTNIILTHILLIGS